MKRFCFLVAFLAMGQGMFAATEKVMSTRATVDTNLFLAFQPSNTTLQALLEWLDTNWYSLTNRMATKNDLQQYVNDMEQRFLTITNFSAYIASLPPPEAPDGEIIGGGSVTQTIAITSSGTTDIAIPAGAKKLTFYCWGGGGGGCGGGASTLGGGGGFAFGSVGTTNSIASTTAGYVWTGATIRVVTAEGGAAGYGGGYTRISMVTNSYEQHYLVAGGGGGGGYVDPEADNYPGWPAGSWQGAGDGGGGGGTNGASGGSASGSGARSINWALSAAGGGGGAQAASGGGGAGSAAKSGGTPADNAWGLASANGTSGTSWSGGAGGLAGAGVCGSGKGNCSVTERGGSGGAGYKGGGGGGAAAVGWMDSVFENVAGGGGGGSGYINPSFVINGYLSAASGRNPPKTDLWAYAAYSGGNKAVGGSATSGYPGLVVIIVE
jgi:hypothetical protein